ncbi:interferon alpha-inducible protein 27-like protein 2A [Talpa occidentalis]|uniref:interferon alpha-inducible protein 27-like protein 2A n=1 Tax=Talpa occidentalis TaxID=50954 RepID=UPI00188E84CF|nr:interferon alpha-inducible protein 27-like protein 2A [Talpa occidentalis]
MISPTPGFFFDRRRVKSVFQFPEQTKPISLAVDVPGGVFCSDAGAVKELSRGRPAGLILHSALPLQFYFFFDEDGLPGRPTTHSKAMAAVMIGAAVGGVAAVVAAPVLLGAVGFTGAGIAAGSVAAKMMSAAAIANGGGVAAGSLVAIGQSAGMAGLSTISNVILGTVGSAVGALLFI